MTNYLIEKLELLNKKQRELMTKMNDELCDDIHSVLRSKQYAESIIELEVKIKLLQDIIIKQTLDNIINQD